VTENLNPDQFGDLSGPQSFDNDQRARGYRRARIIPGKEAPVFFASDRDRYKPNPFAAHIPEPTRIDHEDGSYTMKSHSGIPGYEPTTLHRSPRRVERLPLNRLESTQGHVEATSVSRYKSRKTEAPPIDVTHYVNEDRYVIGEGNHRATVALLQGKQDIPAYVTRAETYRPKAGA